MSLVIEQAVREFRYNGVALADPGLQMGVDEVKAFYANIYPELNNAAIEGPEHLGNKAVYEFRRAVGTKGATQATASALKTHLAALASGASGGAYVPTDDTLEACGALCDCATESLRAADSDNVMRGNVTLPSMLLPVLP